MSIEERKNNAVRAGWEAKFGEAVEAACQYLKRAETAEARVAELEGGILLQEVRTALRDALDAIDFARTEGFEWPTDPYTRAILKVCPPIRLGKAEPTENTPGTGGEHETA